MRRLTTVTVALALLLAAPMSAQADDEASMEPRATVAADATPTLDPQPEPTQEPTPEPTAEPTPDVTPAPTQEPAPEPTPTPTAAPDPTPTAVTVTLDIPDSATYTLRGRTASASWRLSGFTTNSPSGARITARFSALRSNDGTVIPVADRALTASCGDGWRGFGYGDVRATEDITLLDVDGPVTDMACTFTLRVRNVPNIATHLTGSVSVTATTH